MMRLLALVVLIALAVPTTALAQDRPLPGTVVLSFNKCDLSKVGDIIRMTDSAVVPIAQELVNEGKIFNYGLLTHEWGDEWNVVYYYVVESHEAFLHFWDEFVSRIRQRHPTLFGEFLSRCSEHRDNIYGHAAFTGPPAGE